MRCGLWNECLQVMFRVHMFACVNLFGVTFFMICSSLLLQCVFTLFTTARVKKRLLHQLQCPCLQFFFSFLFCFFSVKGITDLQRKKTNYHHFPFFLNSRETVRFSQMTCEAKRKASERLAGECETVALSLPELCAASFLLLFRILLPPLLSLSLCLSVYRAVYISFVYYLFKTP